DGGRPLLKLQPVELSQLHMHTRLCFQRQLGAPRVELLETPMDPQLQGAQLTVGDDQEVSAAAGRVEECERAEVLEQLLEVALLRACLDEPLLELVKKQGADELQDVGLGRVVLAQSAPGLLVLHRLEQGPEDRRG